MLKDVIQKAILISLKERKETELKVLRFILSGIKYAEINKHQELTDGEVVSLLQKEVKKRKEAIEMFRKAGRQEMVSDEEKQVKVIESYLPKMMSDVELEKIVDEVLNGITDKSNIGRVIGLVMVKVKGNADGAKVAELVKKRLINSG